MTAHFAINVTDFQPAPKQAVKLRIPRASASRKGFLSA
jgi:hypothetical protein